MNKVRNLRGGTSSSGSLRKRLRTPLNQTQRRPRHLSRRLCRHSLRPPLSIVYISREFRDCVLVCRATARGQVLEGARRNRQASEQYACSVSRFSFVPPERLFSLHPPPFFLFLFSSFVFDSWRSVLDRPGSLLAVKRANKRSYHGRRATASTRDANPKARYRGREQTQCSALTAIAIQPSNTRSNVDAI